MNPSVFQKLLADLSRVGAVSRVRDRLRDQPSTTAELSSYLNINKAVIKLAITRLRRGGYVIKNRGSKGGNRAIKGTYHLVKEPTS